MNTFFTTKFNLKKTIEYYYYNAKHNYLKLKLICNIFNLIRNMFYKFLKKHVIHIIVSCLLLLDN